MVAVALEASIWIRDGDGVEREYVPIEVYERVVGVFDRKLRAHVVALEAINEVLNELREQT